MQNALPAGDSAICACAVLRTVYLEKMPSFRWMSTSDLKVETDGNALGATGSCPSLACEGQMKSPTSMSVIGVIPPQMNRPSRRILLWT